MFELLLIRLSGARYLLRFDDICPTMNWAVWNEIEAALDRYEIRPILAVVPDNQDPKLIVDPPRDDFWARVRTWQAKGWAIALHGYQHRYVIQDAGLVGLNRMSEFAGLPRQQQQSKLEAGLSIFRREGIRPRLWVAPGHSFDRTTVELLGEMGIDTICDGFHYRPHSDEMSTFWVPQQMWRLRYMPAGVWTVCLHHNGWTKAELERFQSQVEVYRPLLTCFEKVSATFRGRHSSLAPLLHRIFLAAVMMKRRVRKSTPIRGEGKG